MRPDTTAPASLRQRLAWWMIPAWAVILTVTAVWSYKSAMSAVNHAYDRSLTTAIKAIAENTHATEGRVIADIPYSAMDLFDDEVQERIFYAIIGADGKLLTGYEDLVPPPLLRLSGEPAMTDSRFRDHDVRLAAMKKRLFDPELEHGDTVTIVFAETIEARTHLALQLFFGGLRWQILLIVSCGILIVFALSRTFRPLLALCESIRKRDAEDLTPVPEGGVPSEVLPLIAAINVHIGRLGRMLEARRRFLADAAHQIRTPLAVLGAQAEYGERQADPEEMRQTLSSMRSSIRSTKHMANQMLTLARAEQVNGLIQEHSRIDLVELVREVTGDFALLALDRQIELAFETDTPRIDFDGSPVMLREMVSNLVDNALRYTPAGGHVTVMLRRDGDNIGLRVCDDGPGIAPGEREAVFKRFYRILGSGNSEGSGLGLSIVREVCLAHGGSIRLDDGPSGRGLCVELLLKAD
ncbi:sensor histidine kinase N-terminal domain-containing protein [uncultured Propionivibrio sp.]|uniref:sensor histidine kinase n=1 Tax=uncultured Propionivibrio sp. TaxID=426737 RepID=UPI0029C0B091|nr:sensor histidine kinase N-terminal domain-containing protein [uncultured Propionivibrio sp.]